MRRVAAFGVVAAMAVAVLTGCTTGPNEEAVKAAAEYAEKLTTWADGLETALADVRTALPGEFKEGKPVVEQVGLGDALADPPALKKLDDVKTTPTYLFAAKIAKQVDVAASELQAFEPKALDALHGLGSDAYTVIADLYYDTLTADGARIDAFTDALELGYDSPERADAQRVAWKAFWTARGDLAGTAAKAAGGLVSDDAALATSIAGFMADWFQEDVAFDDTAVATIGADTIYSDAYATFWGMGNLNTLLDVPAENAIALRSGYVEQIAGLAAVLTTYTGASPASSAAPEAPTLGEPYRQVLLDGYLAWDDPGEGAEHATDRLWMLWRIRELEATADAPYDAARAALYEELNRGLDDGQRFDFRPGGDRMLELIGEYSDNWETLDMDQRALTRLEEIVAYGRALRELPTVPKVADGFDEVIALYDELNGKVAEVLKTTTDEFDRWTTLDDLGEEYLDKVTDAATPSLAMLDDDAQMEALIAEAIEATRPGGPRGGGTTESPKPTPSLSLGDG